MALTRAAVNGSVSGKRQRLPVNGTELCRLHLALRKPQHWALQAVTCEITLELS
jgi:hypothetical protein